MMSEKRKTHFKVIVPAYNCEEYIGACLKSIANQTYDDFEAYVIDDNSDDDTPQIIEDFCRTQDHFLWKLNDFNKEAVGNIAQGIKFLRPDPEDIIVLVDGDDWLAHENVLDRVKEEYEKEDCLLTYGTYVEHPSGNTPSHHKTDYPQKVHQSKSYREYSPIHYSHLRTFKHKLWREIDESDLRNEDGGYYGAGGDLSYIFPLLEMAGGHCSKIKDVLYVYNRENPLNDDKVNRGEQLGNEQEIRNKPQYPDVSEKLL